MNAYTARLHRENGARFQKFVPFGKEPLNQAGYCLSTQSFDSDTDYRRFGSAAKSQQRMKVGVQCDDDTVVLAGKGKNGGVFCCGKADFAGMNRIKAVAAQDRCGGLRKTLVKQQLHSETQ